jgi:hypothetical protein
VLHRTRPGIDGLNEPATILAEGSWGITIDEYDGNRLATQRVTLESGETAAGIGAAWDWTSQRDVECCSRPSGPAARSAPTPRDDQTLTHTAEASAVSRSCLRRWVAAS